jgi:hypothetical protein
VIVQTFDQGWGPEWPWKKFEISVVNDMLSKVSKDDRKTVIINSVWYTDNYHAKVLDWLSKNHWDRIILVAMLDSAVPKPEWYSDFGKPVIPLGYYPGKNQIDLCALFFAEKIDLSVYGDLSDGSMIDTAFLCLNRKPHWHRRRLYRQLESFNLLDQGIVTMGSENGISVRSLMDDVAPQKLSPNSEEIYYGIPNDVISLGPPDVWKRCFFNVVTETCWDINHTEFVSEKIYKPIVGMRPFVVYGPDGGKKWLHDRGFATYESDFQDISSDDFSDPNQLIDFLKCLSSQDKKYWQHKFMQLNEKLRYNQDRFFQYVESQKITVSQGIIL